MKEILLAVWLTVLGIGHADVSVCPCSVDKYHFLTCDPGTILRIPDDIQLEQCSINPEEVVGIELYDQPIYELQSRAFTEFTNLRQLMLSFNKISFVAQDAFYGLTKVRSLFLSNNNITQFAKGTFDNLLSLKDIDVSRNDYLNPTYVTSAWHMCHREETTLEVEGNLVFFKDLQMSQSTDLYCDHLMDIQDYSGMCNIASNTTLDCTRLDRIEDSICFLRKLAEGPADYFTNILFDFPVDSVPTEVENFFEGESNSFIKDFNSFPEPTESKLAINQIVKNLTFYSTIFDLSTLDTLTSRKTKKVTIWADTIFTSAPITISHKTIIRARKVSIDHKITMNITKDQLLDSSQDIEIWAMKEEYTSIKNITMRQRKFGLLEILDEVSNTQFISSEKCNPLPKDAIKDGLDISSWFDFVHLNLMYVSAHTIQDSKKNSKLVNQIVNFTLDSTFNSTLVNNKEIYSTVRKFNKLKFKNVHTIPSYSIDVIKELADVLHTKMKEYRDTERAQEIQLGTARGRVEDMQTQFDIIEAQQEAYFNFEMVQLEAMWAATDNAWNFSFDHRNDIENNIGGAMDSMMDEINKMRENDLHDMLIQAQNSIESIYQIIDKYQGQIERYEQLAKASFKVQKDQFEKLLKSKTEFYKEFELFKIAVEDWKAQQAVKKMMGFFSSCFKIFQGEVPDIGAMFDAELLLIELMELVTMMDDIDEMFDDLNLDEVTNISMNSSTDFMTALNRAVDMKMKGPTFDEIGATAQIKLADMNDATNHEVKHTTDVMMALQSISDLGNRMIGEIGEFADKMLSLAERYDERAVAEKDLERAVAEVHRIEDMIKKFDDEKDNFYNEKNKTQQEYEDEINKMKEDYANMSSELREKYKKEITEKFELFKLTFSNITDSYNNRMSSLIESIQRKSYGLKEHSMNQRIIIMVLYQDFCDALFFYSFGDCSKSGFPLISDSFEDLLTKLSDLEWNAITSDDYFPPNQLPENFNKMFVDIKDNSTNEFYPIQIFKNESKLEMNITQFDSLNGFNGFADYWRIRINEINITLFDENKTAIASPGETHVSGGAIKVRITFPNIFIDQSGNKDKHSFLGPSFFCSADYWTHPDLEGDPCKVSSKFTSSQFETSPNGLFKVEIKNPEMIRMQDIDSIRVTFSGTHIPYLTKHSVFV